MSGTNQPLPVVCLSLGGTKIEVGALTREGAFLASPEIHWRDTSAFATCLEAPTALCFCDAMVRLVDAFLERHGYTLTDVDVLGIPFPGPNHRGMWFSNNLTRPFEKGVALEREMANALTRLSHPGTTPLVRVVFDAQCDAGGELYHPAGRLASRFDASSLSAAVLNVATGIAAGFVGGGRVLVSEADFQKHVDPTYDAGAGQLGRHLWYHPDEMQWRYHFCPQGGTPSLAAPAIRMTERLSGPALGARLLLQLGRNGLLRANDWTVSEVPFIELKELYQMIAGYHPEWDIAASARCVRGASLPVAGALLGWADEVQRRGAPASVAMCVRKFATQIAGEFAAALSVWMRARGWGPFGRHIVLTGGVGIRFLASSDSVAKRSFCRALESALPAGCQVERSQLGRATERECYLFVQQPK
jgi:hypothetical protein